jgi:hypothetical protein
MRASERRCPKTGSRFQGFQLEDKPPKFTRPMSNDIRTYAELRKQVRNALRNEHPEWIGPEGNSPICDAYEARLAELLDLFAARERNAGTPNKRGARVGF